MRQSPQQWLSQQRFPQQRSPQQQSPKQWSSQQWLLIDPPDQHMRWSPQQRLSQQRWPQQRSPKQRLSQQWLPQQQLPQQWSPKQQSSIDPPPNQKRWFTHFEQKLVSTSVCFASQRTSPLGKSNQPLGLALSNFLLHGAMLNVNGSFNFDGNKATTQKQLSSNLKSQFYNLTVTIHHFGEPVILYISDFGSLCRLVLKAVWIHLAWALLSLACNDPQSQLCMARPGYKPATSGMSNKSSTTAARRH